MDRAVIVGMVEDYWRAQMPAMQAANVSLAAEIGQRFEQRIAETARLPQPLDAAAFEQTVEAEREKLIAEY